MRFLYLRKLYCYFKACSDQLHDTLTARPDWPFARVPGERVVVSLHEAWVRRKTFRVMTSSWLGEYFPDNKVRGANMGPIWGRQDPGGPHVGPMGLAIWVQYPPPPPPPHELCTRVRVLLWCVVVLQWSILPSCSRVRGKAGKRNKEAKGMKVDSWKRFQ